MRALGLWPVAVLLIIGAWVLYRRRKGTAVLVEDPR